MKTASWIIVNKQTGAAVFETFNPAMAQAINTAKYAVLPALQYLQQLNRQLKKAAK